MIIPLIGQAIVWIIMGCAIAGAIAAIKDEETGLGKEFMMAFHQMGSVFIPIAGMMAAVPYIAQFIETIFGHIYSAIGADLAMAPGMFIAIDLGGYQLAQALSSTDESWIMGAFVCYMAGPIISFTIPVGFSMLDKRDHKYFALGIMAGLLSIPFGVLICTTILKYAQTPIRRIISTDAPSDTVLQYDFGLILLNLIPIIIFCVALALLLRFLTDICVKVFLTFGTVLTAAIKIVLVLSVVEYFTGVFTMIFGGWGFDPIIADDIDQFRALEISGYICVMLAGAFPMVYLIRKYFEKPLQRLGSIFGFSSIGSAGLLASMANLLAMFRLFREIPPEDKVKNMAFAVCACWILGDHVSFTANFQPNLLVILMIGKMAGGIRAILISLWIAVPVSKRYFKNDLEKGVILSDEYCSEDQILPRNKPPRSKTTGY
jgi:ethanolamine transporter